MVGVPLQSLKPNLTYEEKADILEKGRESDLITQGEHHPLVEFSPEEQDLFMEEDRNYDFVINKMRQKQQKPSIKKRKRVDGGGSGTRRDIPTDPAALARAQEILRNAVPLPC